MIPLFERQAFAIFCRQQCDQMARLCFIFWQFTTTKICPKALRFDQVGSKVGQI